MITVPESLRGVRGTILRNSTSLVGTTILTSGLGVAFWALAARAFPRSAVGLASAAISAMALIGTLALLGLGTFLMGELPRRGSDARGLIVSSLVTAGAVGAAFGAGYAVLAPSLSSELRPISTDVGAVALFAAGVSLTAVTLVLDQACIGLLRSDLQLWRNAIFAVTKLVALALAAAWATHQFALIIYTTWTIGNLISLLALAAYVAMARGGSTNLRPRWHHLRGAGRNALAHHAFNLGLQAPTLAMPIVVVALLSAEASASFYIAIMTATLLFVMPNALTQVLYVVGSGEPRELAAKVRFTLSTSAILGAAACVILITAARPILTAFGKSYADDATWPLRIIATSVFPGIVRNHFVALRRISRRVVSGAVVFWLAGTIEIAAAAAGCEAGGLVGLTLCWMGVVWAEAGLMAPTVYRAATAGASRSRYR